MPVRSCQFQCLRVYIFCLLPSLCANALLRVHSFPTTFAGMDAITRSLKCMFTATDFVTDASLTFHKPYSTSEEFCGMEYTLQDPLPFDNVRTARPHQTCQPSFSCQLACATALMLRGDSIASVINVDGSAPACRKQRSRAIACRYVLASSCVCVPDFVWLVYVTMITCTLLSSFIESYFFAT